MIDRRTILNRLERIPDAGRWYAIHNASDPDRATVRIFDEIGYWGVTEEDFARDLAQITASEIEVQISSPGGEVFAGIAIYNQLRAHPAHIITRVDGMAASAASVIVQAGDRRLIMSSAQMMIHEAWGLCMGPAGDMREFADMLDKQSDVIAAIYAARSGGDVARFRDLMRTDTYLTDAEAVELGLADEIFEPPTKPAGAATSARALDRGGLALASTKPSDLTTRQTTGPDGQEENAMDYTDLRAEHGIADDVTDDDIADVLSALAASDDDDSAGALAQGDTPETSGPGAAAQLESPSATELENAALHATVATLTEREKTRSEREAAQAKESTRASAVGKGQITPHEWASVWEPFYDADPAKATEQLSKLPANRIPMTEIGHSAGESTAADDADARYAALTASAPTYGKRG
jgi:ATP-dependent Clp endopeptidase proteolytic subunit ClpP